MKPTLTAFAATALLAAGSASAQTPGPRSGERAEIPFASYNGIRDYQADRLGEGVYLQDNRRNWYYARFATPCRELDFALGIGLRPFGASTTLSSGDSIQVGRERCYITDLVRSGPPPSKKKHAKKR